MLLRNKAECRMKQVDNYPDYGANFISGDRINKYRDIRITHLHINKGRYFMDSD